MTTSQTAHPTEGELLPCPFCGETDFAMGDVEDTAYFASCSSGGHAVNCPSCGTIGPSGTTAHEAITTWNTRPDVRPQGEEGLWRPSSEAPAVSVGDERGFIVAVRRAHSGKVYSFAAIYLNAKPLLFEDEEEERPVTGWHDITADEDRGDTYHQALTAGDELIAWREIPQFAAISNQGKPSS